TLQVCGLNLLIVDDQVGVYCLSHFLVPLGLGPKSYFGSLRYAACPCFSWYSRFCDGVIWLRRSEGVPPPPDGTFPVPEVPSPSNARPNSSDSRISRMRSAIDIGDPLESPIRTFPAWSMTST